MGNTDKTRNYLIEEINQNELMSKKHKNVYRVLNRTEHLLTLIYTVNGCFSISNFASLVGIPIGITSSSAIGLESSVITSVIEKYKSIIKKKKKKHDKILWWGKSKLNSVKVLISKPLLDSNIGRNKLALINNLPNEFDDMKKEIKKYNHKLKLII